MAASFWSTLLDYIDVLRRPLVVGATLIFVFRTYRDEIGRLIDRINELRGPGGTGLGMAPSQQSPEEAEPSIEGDNELLEEIISDYERELAERQEERQQSEQALIAELVSAQIDLDFERIYRVIFGSQVQALRALRDVHPASVPRTLVEPIFGAVKAQFSDAFAAWSFEMWIAFLLREGYGGSLVEQLGDGTFRLTLKGSTFLDYVEDFPPKVF